METDYRKLENDIKIMSRAIVCEDTTLHGDITFSYGCIIHPSVTIIAESGPIVFGENCIVEEYSTIIHRIADDMKENSPNDAKPTLKIGINNVFEVGCRVEALKIGDKNVFECRSFVSPNVQITNGCVIGAGCHLEGEQILSENTVIYGKKCLQRESLEKQGSQTLQIDYLRKVIPNYHHLRKATIDPKKLRAQI